MKGRSRVYHCPYCSEGSGIILPEDLSKATRMPDGSLMCYTCRYEVLRDRIVRVAPNSKRAQKIKAEDRLKVDYWNRHIQSSRPESEIAKVNPRPRLIQTKVSRKTLLS